MEIKELLNRHGQDLSDFPDLPKPNPKLVTNMDNRLIKEALAFDTNKIKTEHQQLHALLNPEQRLIYEHVLHSVYNQEGQFYFVYGPGGTGKTFLYKTITERLRSERMIVLAVASSGIVSLLLPGGRTVFTLTRSMRVNEYYDNGDIDTRKQDFNKWVLAVGDGTVPAKKNKEKMRQPGLRFQRDTLEQHNLYPVEFLNSLNFPGMPSHSICLKKELPIMLIRNVNPSKGLCNGTRLIITDLGQFVI
ncbi:ATP-dependent DNA helicase PIF1-like protein [Tanacetum coccineum]